MESFYDVVRKAENVAQSFAVILGEGTPYEAVARLVYANDDWQGFIVFKDLRLSPPDPNYPYITLKYNTPRSANGTLAATRAQNHWAQLCSVFKSIGGIGE